jgi:hypothetical protein
MTRPTSTKRRSYREGFSTGTRVGPDVGKQLRCSISPSPSPPFSFLITVSQRGIRQGGSAPEATSDEHFSCNFYPSHRSSSLGRGLLEHATRCVIRGDSADHGDDVDIVGCHFRGGRRRAVAFLHPSEGVEQGEERLMERGVEGCRVSLAHYD